MNELVLASASPRRAELLRQIGLEFRVVPSFAQEIFPVGMSPAEIVMKLALDKAREVADRLQQGLIIGADTIVVLADEVLGKPVDSADACRILNKLSGREHSVFTGLAVIDGTNRALRVDFVETKVWFRTLTQAEIENYVSSGEPLDKAGAYGIQGLGAVLVERIDGCYYNVVGLPLSKLVMILQEMGKSLVR